MRPSEDDAIQALEDVFKSLRDYRTGDIWMEIARVSHLKNLIKCLYTYINRVCFDVMKELQERARNILRKRGERWKQAEDKDRAQFSLYDEETFSAEACVDLHALGAAYSLALVLKNIGYLFAVATTCTLGKPWDWDREKLLSR